MKINIHRLAVWAWPLLLAALLCGCTAKAAATDESGLPPHLTVNLHLPAKLETGAQSVFTVEVLKGGKPLENADKAEFIIWPEGKKEASVTVKANEASPGVYTVSHTITEEGLYVVQSRISAANEQVMPAKRFAVGADAIERLALLESATETGAAAAAKSKHH